MGTRRSVLSTMPGTQQRLHGCLRPEREEEPPGRRSLRAVCRWEGSEDWKVSGWLEGDHNNPAQGSRGKGRNGPSERPQEGSVDQTQLPSGSLSSVQVRPMLGKSEEMVASGIKTGERQGWFAGHIFWFWILWENGIQTEHVRPEP